MKLRTHVPVLRTHQNFLIKLIGNTALLSFISLLHLNVSAATYDLRVCSTQDQLCSTCKKLDIKVTPKINIQSNNVIINLKLPNKSDSQSLSNCKIIDSDNWDCTEPFKSELSGISGKKTHSNSDFTTTSHNGYKMVNGELINYPLYHTVYRVEIGYSSQRRITEPYYNCFIKDSFFNFLK